MRKLSILLLICLITCISYPCIAQNVSVNQYQQNVNINLPVIEKKVYIDRYRTVYVEKPRVAKKLSAPIQLLGYLWVYPEDLGNFNQVPSNVLYNVNSNTPYDRNNWRIPTPDELAILEANADKVGLGNDIYLSTDHRNGVLRLVSTGNSLADNKLAESRGEVVNIDGTLWATKNHGASSIFDKGYGLDRTGLSNFNCPQGWRLPTVTEFNKLANGEFLLYSNRDEYYRKKASGTIIDVFHYVVISLCDKQLTFYLDSGSGYGASVIEDKTYYLATDEQGSLTRFRVNTGYNEFGRDHGGSCDFIFVRLVKE